MKHSIRQPATEPHHDGSALYLCTLNPKLGETVRVRLRVPHSYGLLRTVRSRSNPDHEPRWDPASVIASTATADWWQADVVVENPVHGYRFLLEHADGRASWVNAAGTFDYEPPDADDFRLSTHPAAPDWVQQTVLYQVFPDRFGRSAAADGRAVPEWAEPASWTDPVDQDRAHTAVQFYGGDLDGVIEHLDHLERLGVTMIYLTPVFPAGSNHRYDAASFLEVDPLLGGDEALIRLVEAAHARGLRVIGDLTANHSGDRHEWFQSAYRRPEAAESGFYYWLDAEHTRYASWRGVPSLPKFNWNSVELRRRFIEGPDSVVARWLKAPYSFDGWRIDVANMTGRFLDDDLNETVRRTIRATMTQINSDAILLAESTNDTGTDFQGDAWHGAMSYANFTRPLWSWLARADNRTSGGIGLPLGRAPEHSGVEFYQQHRRFAAGLPWRSRLGMMNALDTHDTGRFAGIAREGVLPVAVGLSMTLPGVPVVWAGDEFGLHGDDGEHSRTPIPWHAVAEPAVAERIELYARLIRLKREHSVLGGGGIRWLHVSAEALAFVREDVAETVLVVATRSAAEVVLPAGAVGAQGDTGAVLPTKQMASAEHTTVDGFETSVSGKTPPEHITWLFGDLLLSAGADGALTISAPGPAFGLWRLPGETLPPFSGTTAE